MTVPDATALARLAADARAADVAHATFVDDDLGAELTALALAPVHAARRLCAGLPLALKDAAT